MEKVFESSEASHIKVKDLGHLNLRSILDLCNLKAQSSKARELRSYRFLELA